MDFDLLLMTGVSAGACTFIFFIWFMFGKKQSSIIFDKKTESCSKDLKLSKSTNVYINEIEVSKTLSLQIKNFLIKHPFNFFRSLKFSNRLSFFTLILKPFFVRVKLRFKNKEKTEQNKAEISLDKLAKSLWNSGKYSEAEKIKMEVLNVRRIVGINKK
jgi:GR25 family glycosyltransferase involved in LPS biosynthesis